MVSLTRWGGRVPLNEWSALGLLRHCHAPRMVRVIMQVWAGTVADTRAQHLLLAARKRAWSQDVKEAYVQCPCGAGPQDSVHLLVCQNAAVKALRDEARVAARAILLRERGEARALRLWDAASVHDCVCATLGGTCVQLSERVSARVVSRCAAVWVALPMVWRQVNVPSMAGGLG